MTGPATAAIDRLLQAGFAQQQKGHLGQAGDPSFDAIAERPRDTALTPEPREQLHHGDAKISNNAGLSDKAKAHFAISKACRPEGGWTVFRSR